MSVQYIKKFSEKENEFISECGKKKLDYSKLQKLIDVGVNVNAYEERKYDNGETEISSLIEDCLMDSQECERNYVEFLEFMDKNGFDFPKYANNIFSVIQFTYSNQMIEMTKYILSKVEPKDLDEESCLSGIGTEESYSNCCLQDHERGNYLSTIYEMIEKFIKNGCNPDNYFKHDKIFGQKIRNIKIFCDDVKIDTPKKFICNNFDIFIDCDKDRLCILNKYIFVNNNDIITNLDELKETNNVTKDNAFGHAILEYAENEKIINIELKDKTIETKPKTFVSSTLIVISLSNDKQIKITLDESIENMKITLK